MVAGVFMCVGSAAPWLHATALGRGFDYGGLHSDLDGKWVLSLGLAAVVIGAVLGVLPAGHDLRPVAAVAVMLVGVVGLAIAGHQYVKLSDAFSAANGALGAVFGIHVESGWGLWLAGLGSAGVAGTGFVSLVS